MKKAVLLVISPILTLCFAMPAVAEIVINAGGDTGFNRDMNAPLPNYTHHKGRNHDWSDMTKNFNKLFDPGAINFVNFEAVVSDRQLREAPKKWKFVSHPNSVEHLIQKGINLFSLANNHSYDYGREGLMETKRNMNVLKRDYNNGIIWHGVGTREETIRPAEFTYNGVSVAFSAIGFVETEHRQITYNSDSLVGSVDFRKDEHYEAVLRGLKASNAKFKILSIHEGTEGVMITSGKHKPKFMREVAKFRRAVDEAGVNFVIGSHPHVVRPVEIYKGSLIAYSLGNLLLVGARDIGDRPFGLDYGLVLKTKFEWSRKHNKYSPSFIEAIPLKSMQMNPHPINERREEYAGHINHMNRATFGEQALQFGMDRNSNRAFVRPEM
jgi:poly-gamma-glutamate synthesis protein (capsule biosynthesis protein)